MAAVPLSPEIWVADSNVGLLFILAMSSMTVYASVLGGWASNNKYALLGGLRSAAQMVSYEVFMGIALMGVVVLTGDVIVPNGITLTIEECTIVRATPLSDDQFGGVVPELASRAHLVNLLPLVEHLLARQVVAVLLGVVYAGVGLAGQQHLFGVVVPYVAVVLFLILVQSPLGYANPCDAESRYFCMRIVDASQEVPYGEARALILDHLQHSTNHREDPELIAAPYLHLIDQLGRRHTQDNDSPAWFFAGGGAYTLPRTVNAYNPRARVVVAEIDPAVTDIAQEQLYLDTANMEIIHEDARVALAKQPQGEFDVVVGDVFHDIAVPYHLLTQEFAALVKSRLKPDGIYLMNLVDGFPEAKLLKSLYKTLQQEFARVDIWLDHVSDEPTRMTYIVSAHNNDDPMPERILDERFGRQWINITEPALAAGTGLDELPLLTDDYVPVERLLAELLAGELGR